ncbi:MAG: HlyD family secretion protein [Bacteroidales bacterium]
MAEQPEIWEHDYEVEELLGKRPAWITRWGILVSAILLVFLIVGSYLIRYPDIVVSPITVTSENPPASMVSRVDGKIVGLFVKDKQKVKAGDVLLLIENPATYKDVLFLDIALKEIRMDSAGLKNLLPSLETRSMLLGDVQPAYTDFFKSLKDYTQFLSVKEFPNKIKALKQEEKMTKAYSDRLRIQGQVLEKDLKLGKKQFARDSALFHQKVISSSEYEKSESNFLQKKFAVEGNKVSLANNNIQLSQLQKDILDISIQYQQKKNELTRNAEKAYQDLLNQIETWKQNYLMVSPVAGVVTFNQYWNLYQYIKKGEKVITVVPPGKTRMIGKVNLTVEGAGKVKQGQQVNIKFSGYPYLEFGMVKGVVSSKSLVPQDNKYMLEVDFTNGLVTSYNKKLEYQPEMSGTAEIVTEDVRLLERLLNPIRYLVTK